MVLGDVQLLTLNLSGITSMPCEKEVAQATLLWGLCRTKKKYFFRAGIKVSLALSPIKLSEFVCDI